MKRKLLILLALLLSGCATVDVTVPDGYIEAVIRSGYFVGCGERALKECKTREQIKENLAACHQRADTFDLRQIGIYPPEIVKPEREPHGSKGN